MNPFFSIIIPTLNSGKTLYESIESVLKQSFPDFEILIIDGHSFDNTLFIANQFNDKRINILSEKDDGIYYAMNKGIKKSKGQWLYFLGSDDRLINLEILQKVFIELSNKRVDVIYGNVISPRFNGRYDGEFTYSKITKQNICHQSIFFGKSVFDLIGSFNLKFKSQADWDHNLRWFLNSKVKKSYFDMDIAEYSDGGFSSVYPDELFDSEKNLRILRYGFFSLPLELHCSITSSEHSKAMVSKHYLKAILLKFVNLFQRFRLRLQ